jgi:hypothetical protein
VDKRKFFLIGLFVEIPRGSTGVWLFPQSTVPTITTTKYIILFINLFYDKTFACGIIEGSISLKNRKRRGNIRFKV